MINRAMGRVPIVIAAAALLTAGLVLLSGSASAVASVPRTPRAAGPRYRHGHRQHPVRGVNMLGSCDLIAFTGATDLGRARAFYEQTLGLPLVSQDNFACTFDANGTMLRVTAVPHVSRPGYTVLGWRVRDIEAASARR
jgi:hypothetical protein